jgi:hypothetical protein
MPTVDFEKEMADFVGSSQGGSPIKEIYKIIPTLNNQQIRVLMCLRYYIRKYSPELDPLSSFIQDYLQNMGKNKNLGFLQSNQLRSLLKAYTQDEMLRGIKISSTNIKEGEQ